MKTFLAIYHYRARTFAAALAGVCALSVFLYGAFLLGAVAHAAKHAEAQRQTGQLSGKLAELEGKYLSFNSVLTEERARELGFVAPKSVTVVKTSSNTLSLNFSTALVQQ